MEPAGQFLDVFGDAGVYWRLRELAEMPRFSWPSIGLAVASLFALRTGHSPPGFGTGLASVLDVAPYFFLGSLFAVTSLYRILNTGFALFLVGLVAFFSHRRNLPKSWRCTLPCRWLCCHWGWQTRPI